MNLVVHMTEVKPGTTLASARIAQYMMNWLSKREPVRLVDTLALAKAALKEKNIGHLYVINGPTAFCNFREHIEKMTLMAEQVIWVQNDYTCYPPSQMKRALRKRWPELQERSRWQRPPIVWTTCEERVAEPADRYVNWNQLTFQLVNMPLRRQTPGLFYYGACRSGRRDDFARYFKTTLYPVTISTSARAGQSFKKLAPKASIVPPFASLEEVAKYRATVYMEDRYSHFHFTSLANRFYECLSAGIAQFIDRDAANTFKEAGLHVKDDWVVHNAKDVSKLLPAWRGIADTQYKLWTAHKFLLLLDKQFERAYQALKDF